jgi:hypothetical protein
MYSIAGSILMSWRFPVVITLATFSRSTHCCLWVWLVVAFFEVQRLRKCWEWYIETLAYELLR